MCAHILVAEDNPHQAELVRRYLEHDGHSVVVVHDGRSAIDEARRRGPDLLVLDVMMPVVDGLDVVRALRADSDVPIVLLTARSAEDDVLLGFDLGADDYVTKPFRPRQLVARVRTILRRAGHARAGHARGTNAAVLKVGDIVVDPTRHEVTLAGEPVGLTPMEFRLLSTLAAQPHRVFTRGQLLQDGFTTERTVDVHIVKLRRKIEHDPRRPRRLLTVYGIGYKLV